jgi:hypothetical protein
MALTLALPNNFNFMKKIALLVLLMGTIYLSPAQLLLPVRWNYTTISFTRSEQYQTKGKYKKTKSSGECEYALKVQVYYFGHQVTFQQTIRLITTIKFDVKGATSPGCFGLQQLLDV